MIWDSVRRLLGILGECFLEYFSGDKSRWFKLAVLLIIFKTFVHESER